MKILKNIFKLILSIFFVIIFFPTLQAKNIDRYNEGSHISDYFSGILLLSENQYKESLKFLNRLNGLEKFHKIYPSRYLFSLINSGKFLEAYNYSKSLERSNLNNYESDLIIGIYYLKNKKFGLAQEYFQKLKNYKSTSFIDNFVSNSLYNWSSFSNLKFMDAQNKINQINPKLENLKKIQNTFLQCFYQRDKTEDHFIKLISNTETDFSRYSYFFANYLYDLGKINEAKKILNSSLKLYPRNLLLNQYKLKLKEKKFKTDFNCRDISHVSAEILYISANALSSQYVYSFSNFYLNLSKYLNKGFNSFDNLLAENYYKMKNYKEAKKIYNKISKNGEFSFWYAAKQNAKILKNENNKDKAIDTLKISYNKLKNKGIYEKFDYAKFLKNNDQFQKSITIYTEILKDINKKHPLYPKVVDGRGVAYERTGNWKKAEKDLMLSIELNPDQAYVINYLAYSWIEKGVRIEQSLKMLEKANSLSANDPYIIDSLGWALFKLKRYKASAKYLQTAVKLLPADPVINDHYGDVLWKNGNEIQARYYWQYVLKLEDTEISLKDNIKKKLILGL